jgi:hypothetical protein
VGRYVESVENPLCSSAMDVSDNGLRRESSRSESAESVQADSKFDEQHIPVDATDQRVYQADE